MLRLWRKPLSFAEGAAFAAEVLLSGRLRGQLHGLSHSWFAGRFLKPAHPWAILTPNSAGSRPVLVLRRAAHQVALCRVRQAAVQVPTAVRPGLGGCGRTPLCLARARWRASKRARVAAPLPVPGLVALRAQGRPHVPQTTAQPLEADRYSPSRTPAEHLVGAAVQTRLVLVVLLARRLEARRWWRA